jgi:hypothetical protein
MNVKSEPEVRPTLDPREPARSLKIKVKQGYEIDTESRKSQDSSSSEVLESRNVKHRNLERRRTVSDTGSWKSRDSSSSGVPEL